MSDRQRELINQLANDVAPFAVWAYNHGYHDLGAVIVVQPDQIDTIPPNAAIDRVFIDNGNGNYTPYTEYQQSVSGMLGTVVAKNKGLLLIAGAGLILFLLLK